MVAALLPLVPEMPRPARYSGLACLGEARPLDAARPIREEWDAMTAASIGHCCVESTILPPPMSVSVVSTFAEYKSGLDYVGSDGEEVLALLGSTYLAATVISGKSASDVREGVLVLRFCGGPRGCHSGQFCTL